MQEIIVNLHMHTRYSDGTGSHREIARAALRQGLDAVIVTDHNVRVGGLDGYVGQGSKKLLFLVGEEIHDRTRLPQSNHLLALGARYELSAHADDPQRLLARARMAQALTFIAHLYDPAAPAFQEPDISWNDWSVTEFTGIELWNGMSELKSLLSSRVRGIFYAFLPSLVPHGPAQVTLERWDRLIRERRIVAIGGSDAHAFHLRLGPIRRTVFPYEFHFGAINTHVLLEEPLSGDAGRDAAAVYDAISSGHCFVGCDLGRTTRGFRFTAHGSGGAAIMGDEIPWSGGTTLQAVLPDFAEIQLLKDGEVVHSTTRAPALTYLVTGPGAYRVEAYRRGILGRRGWIFSNPIYVR